MKNKSLKIVADPTVIETAIPNNDSRATRFPLAINTSISSSPEYALSLNSLKKMKIMLPLMKFYLDQLSKTGLSVEDMVLNHKKVNKDILAQIQP